MTVVTDPLNIIISGVGGQGNVFASQLIGHSFLAKGNYVTIGETYGAAQRGGPVMSHVRVSEKSQRGALIPDGQGHVIIGLEPLEAVRMITRFGNNNVVTLVNTWPVRPLDVVVGNTKYPEMEDIRSAITELSKNAYFIDATQIAVNLGNAILSNVVMVGGLLAVEAIPLKKQDVVDELKRRFTGNRLDMNLMALQKGMDAVIKS